MRAYGLLGAALTGAALFLALHLVFRVGEAVFFPAAQVPRPWFLNSRTTILLTLGALFLLALGSGLRERGGLGPRLVTACAQAGGVFVAMAGTLLAVGPAAVLTGPARLWPVALLAGLLLTAPAIALGAALAAWLTGAYDE